MCVLVSGGVGFGWVVKYCRCVGVVFCGVRVGRRAVDGGFLIRVQGSRSVCHTIFFLRERSERCGLRRTGWFGGFGGFPV